MEKLVFDFTYCSEPECWEWDIPFEYESKEKFIFDVLENPMILDTHLGSGSSRIAAYKGGFNFIGFEIDPEYYEKQEKRFKNFTAQQRLF